MMDSLISKSALGRLLAAIGGDRDELKELREDYLAVAPELAQRLARAHGRADLDTLRITAHELKSNARDFGAERLADLCEAVERRAKPGMKIEQTDIENILRAEEAARVSLTNMDLSDV